MNQEYPWNVVGTPRVLVDHSWRQVADWTVALPGGAERIITVDESGPGGGTLALNARNEVILLEFDHFASKLVGCLELPGGRVRINESPLQAAQREFVEETGFIAENWEPIFPTYRFPVYSTSNHHLFLATNARVATEEEMVSVQPDTSELIKRVVLKPFQKAFDEIGRRIVDSPTINALQWLQIELLTGRRTLQ